MLEINEGTWHYKVVQWVAKENFRYHDPPDLCSYVRAVVFWAPWLVVWKLLYWIFSDVVETYNWVRTIPVIGTIAEAFKNGLDSVTVSPPYVALGNGVSTGGRIVSDGFSRTNDWLYRKLRVSLPLVLIVGTLVVLPLVSLGFSDSMWWKILAVYGVIVVMVAIIIGVVILLTEIEDSGVANTVGKEVKNRTSIVIEYLKALKRRTCPLLSYKKPLTSTA